MQQAQQRIPVKRLRMEVERTVSAESSRRPHGTGEDNGFLGFCCQVRKPCRLFHRVSAVRDHDTGCVGIGGCLFDRSAEFKPDAVGHRTGVDIGDLMGFDACEVLQFGHRAEQCFNIEAFDAVARQHERIVARTHDRAAGAEDYDFGKLGAVGHD